MSKIIILGIIFKLSYNKNRHLICMLLNLRHLHHCAYVGMYLYIVRYDVICVLYFGQSNEDG